MAKRKNISKVASSFVSPAKSINNSEVSDELGTSFLEYAYSVITDRALVDARDGLKPVHRRILFSMFDSGLTPEKAYVKAAKVVGDVMGNYHPHGDSSIYSSLVGITQPFNMMLPLADGHGNWGSPDDGPAAPRYTETRLDNNAMLIAGELKEDVVDKIYNYDGTREMPDVMPVQYPNTLINGQTGIAVGMATKMPTHNPGEVMDAARWLLTHPNADLSKLMEFVPGPDFPTGGVIIGVDPKTGEDRIREAYETGRGAIKIRGLAEIEAGDRGKSQVVITQLPYGVGAEKIIEKAVEAIKAQKLTGVSDIKNLTDRRKGTRIVFVVKAGFNPKAILHALYAYTELETTFGINNVCLVNGQPQTLGLKDLLQIFLDHRIDIVMRRSLYRRAKREKRLHLVEGLLKALIDIDKVIQIVRNASDSDDARTGLIKKFKVDEIQADHILSIQLRRLTKFDQHELANERDTLKKEIKELTEIIDNDSVLRKVVADELAATKKIIDKPRASQIVDADDAEVMEDPKVVAQSISLEVDDANVSVAIYSDGSIKRAEGDAKIKSFTKSGKVVTVLDVVPARLRGGVVLISNKGRAFKVSSLHIGEKVTDAKNIVDLEKGEQILTAAPIEDKTLSEEITAGVGFFFATKNGAVKITNPDYPQRSDVFEMISLADGDEIVYARWVDRVEGAEIALLSSDTSLLRFSAEKVRPQGRSGSGMAGIKLADGAIVIEAALLSATEVEEAVVVTSTGETSKVSPFNLYPAKGRATGGVRSQKLLKGEDGLTFGSIRVNPIVVDENGSKVELPKVDTRRDGSGTKIDSVYVSAGS